MIEAKPSATAYRVALRRAAHQMHDRSPLVFVDPLAVRILGPAAAQELAHVPNTDRKPHSAALRAWIVARARFAEEALAAAVAAAGTREVSQRRLQYLVLGAGLDTFALRNLFPEVRVFEVDHPATQEWKRQKLASAGLVMPKSARFVSVDFERQELAEELQNAGFDPGISTVTAWLGVVPYLTPAAFRSTVDLLGRLMPGSAIVFDYAQPREVLLPVEQLMRDSLASRVAQAGEPFQLFFTPETLQAALLNAGVRVLEDLGSTELNMRYFAERTDGLQLLGSSGRLCHAVVP
ncbi:MAG: class I SAM-dependent methyltransferase [Janthinobacterium lividum]